MKSPEEIERAKALFFDAIDAYPEESRYDCGYFDREFGVLDGNIDEIMPALLAYGWIPPNVDPLPRPERGAPVETWTVFDRYHGLERILMGPGDQTIEYNGVETAVRDIPSAFERAQFGYGHFPGHGRQVVDAPEMNWPHTPDTCPTDEVINRWLFAGTDEVLVCMGCGLDVT